MNEVERIGEGIFELEQEIGRGGAATVWKATESEEPRRQVAVKLVIYPESEYLKKQDSVDNLFAREARTWAEFQRSPYVVQLYRTFSQKIRSAQGFQYAFGFVMEFCAEGDLRRTLREKRLMLDRPATIALILDIARGLKEGHDKDILHRDLKSSNVLLFKNIPNKLGPKLMDFGLSITTDSIDGRLVGTPEYMAPEVFDSPRDASKASDVYSLGILFYEILSGGTLPFHFSAQSKQERLDKYRDAHQNATINLEEIRARFDKGIVKLLDQMLQKAPTKRLPLNRILAHLEKFKLSEIVETLKVTPEESREKESRYIWNPSVHASLGELLAYFVIRGTSIKGDPTWLTNNLKERGFHGFSIYTIIGGYDYILRIWYPRDSADELEQVLREFRDFHNGSFLRFNVRQVPMIRGKGPLKGISEEGDLLNEIAQCFSHDQHAESKTLRENGFILGSLSSREARANSLRLFLTVNVGDRTEPFLISAYAKEFAKQLNLSEAASISVYEGDGDFQILIKFRLKRFEQFSGVYESFLTTKALIQRSDSLITSRTFIEFAGIPPIESDDGIIISEVCKLSQPVDL